MFVQTDVGKIYGNVKSRGLDLSYFLTNMCIAQLVYAGMDKRCMSSRIPSQIAGLYQYLIINRYFYYLSFDCKDSDGVVRCGLGKLMNVAEK